MKLTPKTIFVLLALAAGTPAFAQSNRGVPGPSDYDSFSRFITDRNIFDPSRVPHYSGSTVRPRHTHVSPGAPFLSLVGIMSYQKGLFAFFNSNDSDLKQVLPLSGTIAHYTITGLTTTEAKLVSDDKKETLNLKVGDVLRQENGRWELSDNRHVPADATSPSPASSQTTTSTSTSTDTSAPAPSSADQPNEILKRLMQLREKENQ